MKNCLFLSLPGKPRALVISFCALPLYSNEPITEVARASKSQGWQVTIDDHHKIYCTDFLMNLQPWHIFTVLLPALSQCFLILMQRLTGSKGLYLGPAWRDDKNLGLLCLSPCMFFPPASFTLPLPRPLHKKPSIHAYEWPSLTINLQILVLVYCQVKRCDCQFTGMKRQKMLSFLTLIEICQECFPFTHLKY